MKNLYMMQKAFYRYIQREEAVTAIEYALIVSLIAIAIITAVTLIGTNVSAAFNTISAAL